MVRMVALRRALYCCLDFPGPQSGLRYTAGSVKAHTRSHTALAPARCQYKHMLSKHYLDEWMEEGTNVTKETFHGLHCTGLKS